VTGKTRPEQIENPEVFHLSPSTSAALVPCLCPIKPGHLPEAHPDLETLARLGLGVMQRVYAIGDAGAAPSGEVTLVPIIHRFGPARTRVILS
jgi:hypothetical protein